MLLPSSVIRGSSVSANAALDREPRHLPLFQEQAIARFRAGLVPVATL